MNYKKERKKRKLEVDFEFQDVFIKFLEMM
jgi:hypothetical protein